MIAVPDAALDAPLAARLQALQDRIDALDDYAAQVEFAKSSWENKSVALFDPLKERLAGMCSGNRRCAYCEDSYADEIEHMRPKDLYPQQAYVWHNYVLACGPCNGPKNSKFSVLAADGALVDVSRRRGAPVVEPAAGAHALVDPRIEDPVRFLWLDFRTGHYVPADDREDTVDFRRARYTIDVLRLNARDDLVRGRRAAFSGFQSRLGAWVAEREDWSQARRDRFVADFRAERFRGVWERMKRHCEHTPMLSEVAELLEKAPEAATW
jgi:uncharacterized protein (TIGR02646 family)